MAIIKNPPMLAIGSGDREVTNGQLGAYLAYGSNVAADTFVNFVVDGGVTKVQAATSAPVDGITQTACTTAAAGKVWVLVL